MSLTPGTRLGSFEIGAQIGVGGMGEVYRATDTNLKRQVAIKVLPDAVATDAERIARFQREAEVLASLNHPNIAAIHGLERADAQTALVMELVEGPTLADRIAHGPIPLVEALPIATQIADALEAAHETGIIHRDLKPANIKLRPDGTVKVLDFGLAKVLDPSSAATSPASMTNSPTLTSPVNVSRVGVLLGTAAYMAPEQARGRAVDRRADIWAFGCVLYEMLTGRRAFESDDLAQTLARVIEGEPNWSALPVGTPPMVRMFLQRSLSKAPNGRIRDIGDMRLALDGAFDHQLDRRHTDGVDVSIWWRWGLLVAVVLAAGAALSLVFWPASPLVRNDVARFEVPLPSFGGDVGRLVTISPDGQRLFYVEVREGKTRIVKRDLAGLSWSALPGTDNALTAPFFSPDGRSIGFITDSERAIRTVSQDGGTATLVVRTPDDIYSPAWMKNDTIVFGSDRGLWRVAASGGPAEVLVKTDVVTAGPHVLPGGEHIAFHSMYRGRAGEASIEVLTLRTGERRTIAEGMYPLYSAGHLVFIRADNSVWSVPFDAARVETSGPPVRMAISPFRRLGDVPVAVADNGTLVFVPSDAPASRLTWVDRKGTASPVELPSAAYRYPRVSPEGKRISVGIGYEVWVVDLQRATRTRIAASDRAGIRALVPNTAWTPDGLRVTFNRQDTESENGSTMEWRQADAATPAEVLYRAAGIVVPGTWTRDGRTLAMLFAAGTTRDLWLLERSGANPARQWLAEPAFERAPAFSPDNRWIAYVSDDSGQDQVYLQSYPKPGPRQIVSNDGGTEPVWARDGREVYYRSGDRMMAVSVQDTPSLVLGQSRVLFDAPYQRDTSSLRGVPHYDVSADGRFLMVTPLSPDRVVVVLNWQEELKQRVPTR